MDWIKVVSNILDNRKIKMMRKGQKGDTVLLLWVLKLIEENRRTTRQDCFAAHGKIAHLDGSSGLQRIIYGTGLSAHR